MDVIILPSDRPELILGPDEKQSTLGRFDITVVPPEYRSGIGKEGAQAVDEFVRSGGSRAFDASQICDRHANLR